MFLVSCFLFISGQAEAASITRPSNNLGLVGYWTFDGPHMYPNVRDASGQGNHGSLIGQTSTSTVIGKIGQALDFDGSNDRIDINDATSLNASTTFTVAAWVRLDVSPAVWDVIYRSGTQANFWTFGFEGDGKLNFSETGIADNPATTVLANGRWYHVAVVKDGDSGVNVRMYIDGVQDGTASVGTVSESSGTKQVGFNSLAAATEFNGLIDDVRIYNRALSADEVKRLSVAGSARLGGSASPGTLSKGLVGHWTFDGPDMFPNVRDRSGNTKHGNLSGQAATSTVIGRIGQTLEFDGGDDRVTISSGNAANQTQFTITAWVASDNPQKSGVQEIYIESFTGDCASPTIALSIYEPDGGSPEVDLLFDYNNGSSFNQSVTLAASTWYHVVGIFDSVSDVQRVYLNGVGYSTASAQGALSGQAVNVGIGNNFSSCGTTGFDGKIDDVRVYNRALSADEVKRLYNIGAANKVAISASAGSLQSGLVGHWTFDGPDMFPNVRDASGQGNHGSLTGQMSTSTVIGKIGQALDFDGSDDAVSAGDPASGSLDVGTSDFSATMWIQTTDASAEEGLMTKGGLGGIGFRMEINTGVLNQTIQDAGGFTAGNLGTAIFNDGAWHHVAITWDRDSVATGYIDGASVGTQSISTRSATISNSDNFYIGRNNGGSDFTDAVFDDIRFYNRLLSTDEVKRLYNQGR